jgi:hypothetical protein
MKINKNINTIFAIIISTLGLAKPMFAMTPIVFTNDAHESIRLHNDFDKAVKQAFSSIFENEKTPLNMSLFLDTFKEEFNNDAYSKMLSNQENVNINNIEQLKNISAHFALMIMLTEKTIKSLKDMIQSKQQTANNIKTHFKNNQNQKVFLKNMFDTIPAKNLIVRESKKIDYSTFEGFYLEKLSNLATIKIDENNLQNVTNAITSSINVQNKDPLAQFMHRLELQEKCMRFIKRTLIVGGSIAIGLYINYLNYSQQAINTTNNAINYLNSNYQK